MAPVEDKPASNCCGGTNAETGADCCSSRPAKGKSRLRAVIFVVVMLAAMSVGAYSFWSKPAAPACATGQDCGTGGSCCPSASK